MTNPIRRMADDIYGILLDQHESLFGYVPDEDDASKPDRIVYPAPPELALVVGGESLGIGSQGGSGDPSRNVASLDVRVEYRTELTDREWTDGGEERTADLLWKVYKLVVSGLKRTGTAQVTAMEYEIRPPDVDEPATVGFDMVLTVEGVTGVA